MPGTALARFPTEGSPQLLVSFQIRCSEGMKPHSSGHLRLGKGAASCHTESLATPGGCLSREGAEVWCASDGLPKLTCSVKAWSEALSEGVASAS